MIAKPTAWEIQYRLYQNRWQSWKWATPNVYMWFWESDIIAISKADYITEYEIKISVSDYIQDSKKRKHYFLTHGYGPNRFIYILSAELKDKIREIPIPDHAGLYLVHHHEIEMIKHPPLLHRTKVSDAQMKKIYRSNYWRAWDATNTLAVQILGEE